MAVDPPIARLRSISYKLLKSNDSATLHELRSAATAQGFFYLELDPTIDDRSSDEGLLEDVHDMFSLSKKLYAIPLRERLQYDIDALGPHKLNGYKPLGRNEGIAKGKKDGFEAFLVSRDVICNTPSHGCISLPPVLLEERMMLKHFMESCHQVGQTILDRLSSVLDLPTDHILRQSHRPEKPSTTSVGMLRYSPIAAERTNLGHGAHTDVGTITLLFCSDQGLQLLDPEDNIWKFVEPRASCAIVNIGDSARFMVDARMKSSLHRVVPYPGSKNVGRYSLAYFMRPELDAVFRDPDGNICKSIDWHDRKYSVFRASIETQNRDAVLTGKSGYVGLWEGDREE